MTAERERTLRTAQRRMLRWMLGSFWVRPKQESSQASSSESEDDEPNDGESEGKEKLQEETWLEWMRRCTHNAEEHLKKASIEDWVMAQRRRKWRLAGHTARREDHRWSETMLGWQPLCSFRGQGRPCKRWTDDMDSFLYCRDGVPTGVWKAVAQNRCDWQVLEDEFVARAWHM